MTTPDNKKIYDEHWEDWVDMKKYGPASRWLRGLVADHLAPIPKDQIRTVLDMGSGEGTLTAHLGSLLPDSQIKGVDFSRRGVELAQKAYPLPHITFAFDPESEALRGKYDLVTAFEVLEHVEDWQDVLGRMATASTRYVLVSFPTGRMRPFEVHVGHLRNFKKGEVETFMQTRGFEPVTVWYSGFPFYSPIYRNICNLTDSASNRLTSGKYNWIQKSIAALIFIIFRYFSTKKDHGDQFSGLFRRV